MRSQRSLICPILVGRDDVLELATRRLAEAAAGAGELLLVSGEAGVGKSRLLDAVRQTARGLDFRIANGSVAPQDRFPPLSSFLDLARTLARMPGYEALGRDLLTMPDDQDLSALATRRRLVLDVVDRIVNGIGQPTVLEFEDLQWADELTLEILGELARRVRDRPILLVAAYRSDDVPTGSALREWRARLLSQRMAEEIRLAPLTPEQTGLMTTMILATGLPAPRDVVKAVHERTDGIPLHIEELLGALDDTARIDGGAIRDATVPATIEDAVLARVGRLSLDARTVVRAGAVVGRCFAPDVLAGIIDWPVERLDDPIRELTDNAFLYGIDSIGFVDFRHQLLRDAVYRSVPAGDLRRLHARAAEFGAQLEGASEIHASAHFERAGLRADAYRTALAGAGTASRLSLRREAYELYRRAVRNVPDDIPAGEVADLFAAYASALAAIEENDRALDAARTARERYQHAGRPVDAVAMLQFQGAMLRRGASPPATRITLAEQGLAELDAVPPSRDAEEVRGALLMDRAIAKVDLLDLDGARVDAQAALETGRAAQDRVGILDCEWRIAGIDVLAGDLAGGLSRIHAIAEVARVEGHEEVGVTAYRDAAMLAVRVQDYAAATLSLDEGLRYADAIEQSHCRHLMGAMSATVAWAHGAWDEAIARASQEVAEHGSIRAVEAAQCVIGLVAVGRGDLDDGREALEGALSVATASGWADLPLTPLWGLAEADLLDEQPGRAAARCAEARDRATAGGERALLVPFVVTGTRAHLAAGRPEEAERWVDAMSEWMAGPWTELAGPAVAHATGLVRLAGGSSVIARDQLTRGLDGWTARGRTWEAAWARLDLAGCLMRLGRHADAAEHIGAVHSFAAEVGSDPLLRRVEVLRRLARGRGHEEEPWRPLTAREFEVARLVGEGLTNPEIAETLSISPRTAGSHVEHILSKLGVTRRAEIATWVAGIALPARDPVTPPGTAPARTGYVVRSRS